MDPLPNPPVLLALGGETSGLAVLVHGVDDPVDTGVAADGLVLGAARERERREREKAVEW